MLSSEFPFWHFVKGQGNECQRHILRWIQHSFGNKQYREESSFAFIVETFFRQGIRRSHYLTMFEFGKLTKVSISFTYLWQIIFRNEICEIIPMSTLALPRTSMFLLEFKILFQSKLMSIGKSRKYDFLNFHEYSCARGQNIFKEIEWIHQKIFSLVLLVRNRNTVFLPDNAVSTSKLALDNIELIFFHQTPSHIANLCTRALLFWN